MKPAAAVALGAFVVLVLVALPPASATDRTYVIEATGFAWNPNTAITVTVGDVVSFHVYNNDSVSHTFTLTDFSIDKNLPAGTSTWANFTADKAGTFTIRCTIHSSMTIGFTVQSTSGGKTPGPEVFLVFLVIAAVVLAVRRGRRGTSS